MENVMRKKTKRGRRDAAPGEREARRDAARRRGGKGGESGGKSLTVPRWDEREPTSDAAVGQHQQHLRTARCSSRGEGGGGGGRSWEGEADDVKRFELFRRPLHRNSSSLPPHRPADTEPRRPLPLRRADLLNDPDQARPEDRQQDLLLFMSI